MKERKILRAKLAEVRSSISELAKREEDKQQEQEKESLRQKRALVDEKLKEIRALIVEASALSAASFVEKAEALLNEVESSFLSKSTRQEFASALNILRDHLSEAREKAHLDSALSSEDQQALGELQAILKQRKERRTEIKSKLEEYRKAAGRSGLAFEQAITYGTLVNSEKERLEKIQGAIQEIESRISALISSS